MIGVTESEFFFINWRAPGNLVVGITKERIHLFMQLIYYVIKDELKLKCGASAWL